MRSERACAIVAALLWACAPAWAQLQVSGNGRWFEKDGKTIALFGSGIWTIIPDVSVDIEEHNAWYAKWRANANRVALYSFFNAVSDGKGIGPWARTGPGLANDGGLKFDLTKPNEDFWNRARAYFASCERHGICVWLQIFCEPYVEEGKDRWYINPFNSDNNVNSIPGLPGGAVSGEEAFYDPDNPALMTVQNALVTRLLDETAGRFGNIVYEIGNEINMDSVTSKAAEWQRHWVEFFRAHEKERGVPLFLSNNTRRALFEHDAAGFDVVNHHGFWPLRVKGADPIELARTVSENVRQDFAEFGKPIVNSRPCSDPDRTNYPDIATKDEGRRLYWSYFMSGGHIIGFRTTNESWKGGTTAEEIIKNLHVFIAETPLARMAPSQDIIEGNALCLSAPGEGCALYFPVGGSAMLRNPGFTQGATVRWYDPREGTWTAPRALPPGTDITLTAPDSHDWAVLISAGTGQ